MSQSAPPSGKGFAFEVVATDGDARRGRLSTRHGVVDTPAFMPVATLGAVKGLTAEQLERAGTGILLANLYHLSLRPGVSALEELGGVHRFIGWNGPVLTDSGGFQVFSLAEHRRVDEEGVTFRSHLDGSLLRFTPAGVVEAQRRLGVDIAMMLDECPPWPVPTAVAAASWQRTLRWATQAREAWSGGPAALFGIVQGSTDRRLRESACAALGRLDLPGYAIGGVSVGEPAAERRAVVEWCAPALPAGRPRYLMGIGYPEDILHAVRTGVDLFDCVLPARNGRHGVLFTRHGVLRLKNAAFRDDPRPLDAGCGCPACRRHGRAFLHHLLRHEPLTGKVLATLHNVQFYLDFMERIRQAISSGRLAAVGVTDV